MKFLPSRDKCSLGIAIVSRRVGIKMWRVFDILDRLKIGQNEEVKILSDAFECQEAEVPYSARLVAEVEGAIYIPGYPKPLVQVFYILIKYSAWPSVRNLKAFLIEYAKCVSSIPCNDIYNSARFLEMLIHSDATSSHISLSIIAVSSLMTEISTNARSLPVNGCVQVLSVVNLILAEMFPNACEKWVKSFDNFEIEAPAYSLDEKAAHLLVESTLEMFNMFFCIDCVLPCWIRVKLSISNIVGTVYVATGSAYLLDGIFSESSHLDLSRRSFCLLLWHMHVVRRTFFKEASPILTVLHSMKLSSFLSEDDFSLIVPTTGGAVDPELEEYVQTFPNQQLEQQHVLIINYFYKFLISGYSTEGLEILLKVFQINGSCYLAQLIPLIVIYSWLRKQPVEATREISKSAELSLMLSYILANQNAQLQAISAAIICATRFDPSEICSKRSLWIFDCLSNSSNNDNRKLNLGVLIDFLSPYETRGDVDVGSFILKILSKTSSDNYEVEPCFLLDRLTANSNFAKVLIEEVKIVDIFLSSYYIESCLPLIFKIIDAQHMKSKSLDLFPTFWGLAIRYILENVLRSPNQVLAFLKQVEVMFESMDKSSKFTADCRSNGICSFASLLILDERFRGQLGRSLGLFASFCRVVGCAGRCKAHSCSRFGENQGFDLIFGLTKPAWPIIYEGLCASMFDRDSDIQNDALQAFMRQFHALKFDSRVDILKSILKCCKASRYWMANLFTQCKVASWILQEMLKPEDLPLTEMIELLKFGLIYSASPRDVKLLLRFMKKIKNYKTYSLPKLHDIILKLTAAVVEETVELDTDYFFGKGEWDFTLTANNLDITSRGYSALLTIRIDCDNRISGCSIPLLTLSLTDSLEISISECQGGLLIQNVQNGASTEILVAGISVIDNWSNIVFTHQPGIFNNPLAALLVNSKIVWQGSLPYPIGSKDVRYTIGKHFARIVDCGYSTVPFIGRFGSVALFDYAMTQEICHSLFIEKQSHISPSIYHFHQLQENQQPLVVFDPRAMSDSKFVNVSSCTRLEFSAHSTSICNIFASCSMSFSSALRSLGGLDIIYPLLGQLDLNSQSINKEGVELTMGCRLELVLKIMLGLVRNSSSYQAHFINSQSPKLLSVIIQTLPSACLSTKIFELCLDLRRNREAFPVIVDMVEQYILFEPQIWSHASEELQSEYFKQIRSYLDMPAKYGLTYWMDSVEQFFGNRESPPICAWKFIKDKIAVSNAKHEAIRIYESLWCSIDNPNARPLYSIFGELPDLNKILFQEIMSIHGVDILLRLLQSSQRDVRACAFQMIQMPMFNTGKEFEKLKGQILDVPPNVLGAILEPWQLDLFTYYNFRNLTIAQQIPNRKLDQIDLAKVVYPSFLKVIVHLMVSAESIDQLAENIIHEDLMCLSMTRDNISYIRSAYSIHQVSLYMRRNIMRTRDSIRS